MANTDPRAVAFLNGTGRNAANQLAQHYYFCKDMVNTWNAQQLGTIITNDSTIIPDLSGQDGRPIVTGSMLENIINRATEFITDYEASGNAKLNTVLAVANNTRG